MNALTKGRLDSYLLTGDDVKRNFDSNWLNIFDRLHHDLPDRYKLDFIHKAQLSGADPRKNQIHLTSYFSKKLGHKIGVAVFSYHFFLDRANQTGEMCPPVVTTKVEEVFNPITGETVKELVSTASVERKGKGVATYKARWSECYNKMNPIWRERPYGMLEKTAIANVLRWAFPEVLSGMYIQEEVGVDHDEVIMAEKVASNEQDIETTAKQMEKTEEVLEEISKGGRKKKEPIIEEIKKLAGVITKGFTMEQKVQWMSDTMKVDSFTRLNSMKVKELEDLLKKVYDITQEPIVMPDEKFTTDDIPFE